MQNSLKMNQANAHGLKNKNEFEIFLQKLDKYYEICAKYRKWRENDG